MGVMAAVPLKQFPICKIAFGYPGCYSLLSLEFSAIPHNFDTNPTSTSALTHDLHLRLNRRIKRRSNLRIEHHHRS